jgi:pyruvate dehydrogenase E1 component
MASLQAASTSYATHGEPMIPFYMFYSMFGFQRTGDQIWAMGDQRGRGFLIGATAGRTTLAGEGLQHNDGHSHLLASTVPSVRAYDPAFAFELAAIVRDGIERMYGRGEDVAYYVTVYNENHRQPAKPEGADEGIVRGLYRFLPAPDLPEVRARVRLVGSGSIMQQVLAARELLAERFGIAAEVYSATSFGQLRADALAVERWNRLHPDQEARVPYVAQVLGEDGGPVVVSSDWMKTLPDLVAPWIAAPYVVLGTDGFGRSDTREALRAHFEIDTASIAAAALSGLARSGDWDPAAAAAAIADLGVDPDVQDPLTA